MTVLVGALGAHSAPLNGGASPGRTFFDFANPVATAGTASLLDIPLPTGGSGLKVKQWRPNAGQLFYIAESTLPALTTSNTDVPLDAPLNLAVGDIIAFFVPYPGALQLSAAAGATAGVRYVGASDLTADIPSESLSTQLNYSINYQLKSSGGVGGGDQVILNNIPAAHVRNRLTGQITISLSGTYTGSPTSLQMRMHYADNDDVVPGFDWATYIASPSDGEFSGAPIVLPSTTRGYYASVRFSNETAVIGTTNPTVVAVKIVVYGESLARDMALVGSAVTPAAGVYYIDRDTGALSVPAAGDGNVTAANLLAAATGYGVVVATSGSGGMAMLPVNNAANYMHNAVTPTANYNNLLAAYAVGGEPIAMILLVGANDSYHANSIPAEYYQVYVDHFAQLRADTRADLPIFASLTGVHTSAPDSEAYGQHVMAQQAAFDATDNLWDVCHYDVARQDAVHPNAIGYPILGTRFANAIIEQVLGGNAPWQHPRILSAVQTDSTHTVLTLDLGDGDDVSAATAITGVTLSADGSTYDVTVGDVSGSATNQLTVTHASATVSHYRLLFGSNPDVSNPLVSNGLPVMPSQGSVAGPTQLNLTIAGIPDGQHRLVLDYAETRVFAGNVMFAGEAAQVTGLFVPAGVRLFGYWVGDNPPVDGCGITGVTE